MATTCHIHPDRPIHGVCSQCGRPACEECLVTLNGGHHCKSCLEARLKAPQRPISGLLRLVFSVIPGVGHMYMGLMSRGLQLFVLCGVGVGLLDTFDELAAFFVAAVVFYSVFDAREVFLRLKQGQEVPDRLLVDWQAVLKPKWVGYGLIVLGAAGIYKALFNELMAWLSPFVPNLWRLARVFEGTLIGGLAIVAGLYLLRRAAAEVAASRSEGE